MNPPRWDSRYADEVGEALTRMIEAGEEPAAAPPRRSPVRLVVAIVIALLLVVPASITALVLANRQAPAGAGLPVVVPTATSTPTARSAAGGCAPTSGGVPAGADTGQIDDVDGDHRPDTEWAVLHGGDVVFGITTASGATVMATAQFAGGAERTFVVGHLANGVVVVLPSEGRSTDLLTFDDCALQQTEGTNPNLPSVGSAFTLYAKGGGGQAMCLEGDLYSVSFVTGVGGTRTVLGERVEVSKDGRTARLSGRERILASHVTAAASSRYEGISCGTAPVLHPTQGG